MSRPRVEFDSDSSLREVDVYVDNLIDVRYIFSPSWRDLHQQIESPERPGLVLGSDQGLISIAFTPAPGGDVTESGLESYLEIVGGLYLPAVAM